MQASYAELHCITNFSFLRGASHPEEMVGRAIALGYTGLAITDDVRTRTGGRLRLWPGVLYTALKKMTDAGLVVETDAPKGFTAGGGKPRFFRITPAGRQACTEEATYLSDVVAAARAKLLVKAR